ncbi:MAG: DUF1127 domain-containing protein [Silicimonas sp.]|nr:DUF1127 domain-containing protein [Silicimonas sp.]
MSMTHVSPAASPSRLAEVLHKFGLRYKQYRLYRTTLDELRALSDRDLNDLGLTRGMIRGVAYEAAYK